MRKNTALAAWRRGDQTLGGWLSIGNAHTAEIMANMGFDWICIDLQHGLLDYCDLKTMLPAISTSNTTPIVRVPWNEPSIIMKVLDAGAYGVIVPMVNNRKEAEAAVAACRYPPDGMRSFGPVRAALYGGSGYAAEANNQLACVVMIETKDGIENLEEIITTPGVDGVYIGPADLALALGLPPLGDNNVPQHAEMVKHIYNSCRNHNLAVGIHTSSEAFFQRYLKQGFQFVTLGTDSGFMGQAANRALGSARKLLPAPAGSADAEEREDTGY